VHFSGITRGATDDNPLAKLQNGLVNFGEQLLRLANQVAQLEAAVNVLKILAISQLSPDDPLAGLKQLQGLEKILIAADPQDQARRKALDVAMAIQEGGNAGSHPSSILSLLCHDSPLVA